MLHPLISCIVPVFNGERYLREAIDSILAQSYSRLEVIVTDDGSTDGTPMVIAGFGNRIRSLRQVNQGPATARNLGIRAARGEFVAFLDADDLWHPEKLERQIARFQARPKLQYCLAHAQNFWVAEMRAEAAKYQSHRISQPLPGYVTQTLLARRTVFDMVGMFDTTLAHGDSTEWFLRAAELGAVMEVLPDVLTYRRLHPNNRSRLLAAGSREEFLHVVKTSLDRRRGQKPAG
jgi:glycosyltransferase involved in cell wall biosynthesis